MQPQLGLSDAAFQAECRGWDVSDALLVDPGLWAAYAALLRADFSLFDQYACARPGGGPPFDFPVTAFHAARDRKVTPLMVAAWRAFTSGPFRQAAVDGHHLFVLATGDQRKAKEAWFTEVVADLAALKL